MRRLIPAALLLLLVLAVVPTQLAAHGQTAPAIDVRSQYTLDRYGFATINETVKFTNNGTAAVQTPGMTFGIGNLSSFVVAYNYTGQGFQVGGPTGGPYTVGGGVSVPAGNSTTFRLSLLLNGVVTQEGNGSLEVLTLSSPSLSIGVGRIVNVVKMPSSTAFVSAPAGLKGTTPGGNMTYFAIVTNGTAVNSRTSLRAVAASAVADFNPLKVYYTTRTISVGSNGNPMVTDTLSFENMGKTVLGTLYVSPLAPSNVKITVLAASEPRLLSPFSVSLSNGGLALSLIAVGYPVTGVAAGANYTISYQYQLGSNYYSSSGGQVTVKIPEKAPLPAFSDSNTIILSLPVGAKVVQAPPAAMTDVSPWQQGQATLSYALTVGWGVDASIPAASVIFVLLLVGLFVSRTTLTEEEEVEEETSTESASAMITAFEEKTTLINGLWTEIASMDPNELNKEYFDEIRSRLDSFRGRAMQRLNELRQRSTSQKFSEMLNQIQATEREADRAAKDKLNLYEQFYLRRMRKEVYDRLLPQYTKRLERALNQLSDELHLVQREAKLL